MLRRLTIAILCLTSLPYAAAQDEVMRLPGQGELKDDTIVSAEGLGRLIPGGGLLLSFDSDQNGEITRSELESGITGAFLNADANEDGRMTPLEQQRWSESLPTRDVSLANPARFDPNLDRVVRSNEFRDIIYLLAANHTDPATGSIPVIALKAKTQDRPSPDEPFEDEAEERRRSQQSPRTQRRGS